MSINEFLITVVVLGISVQVTRALPFIVFRDASSLPKMIEYLGKVLPAAMMGLLVIYCFKDYDFTSFTGIMPAVLSGIVVVLLHIYKRNTVLSIAIGTTVYMILIRVI